jgi:hypothetical protein
MFHFIEHRSWSITDNILIRMLECSINETILFVLFCIRCICVQLPQRNFITDNKVSLNLFSLFPNENAPLQALNSVDVVARVELWSRIDFNIVCSLVNRKESFVEKNKNICEQIFIFIHGKWTWECCSNSREQSTRIEIAMDGCKYLTWNWQHPASSPKIAFAGVLCTYFVLSP